MLEENKTKQRKIMKRNDIKENKAITLVALVVTIIILIILAAISINLVLGENGILQKTRDGKNNYQVAANEEAVALANLKTEMDSKINGNGGGAGGGTGSLTPGPHGKPLVNTTNIPSTSHEKIIGEDEYGNQVVVPDGFKVADDSGTTVKDGIVIEDSEGNQYVWIPVSNINHDGSNKINVNSKDEEGVEITLGRYTFATSSPGDPTLAANSYQYANSYETPVTINSYFQELKDPGESNGKSDLTGTNTTAKEIGVFINSVSTNKGYYIARYEASYRENGKAGSIQSTSSTDTLALTSATATRTAGDLCNFVKPGEAATACQGLYSTIKSDLMNSYAWDTAIVYIQAMGNTNYANASDGNGTLKNTGATGDQKCKIFDMAGNTMEWTTEYSSYAYSSNAYPCVGRRGSYNNSDVYTRSRGNGSATYSSRSLSFRPTLYL